MNVINIHWFFCLFSLFHLEILSQSATIGGNEVSLVGPYTDNHGYLVVESGDLRYPMREINRFAAVLLCPALFPGQGRTLTWFGYALNTSYFETEETRYYTLKCPQGQSDLASCPFVSQGEQSWTR